MRPPIVAALVACGNAQPAPEPTTTGAGNEFPVEITHAYGTTTIPAKPQRIVALGYNDIAVADAVGAPIVGAVRNYSPDGTGDPNLPYVRTPLSAEVLGIQQDATGGVNLEKVASYRPDLILAERPAELPRRARHRRARPRHRRRQLRADRPAGRGGRAVHHVRRGRRPRPVRGQRAGAAATPRP